MIKVRKGVFETNSSAVHTFIKASDDKADMPRLNYKDHKIHVAFGTYERGDDSRWETDSARGRLEYVVTVIGSIVPVIDDDGRDISMPVLYWNDSDFEVTTEDKKNLVDFLMHSDEFKELEDVVKKLWPKCQGLVLGSKKLGSMDHQTVPDSWDDFKKSLGTSLEDFIGGDWYVQTEEG